MIPLPLPLYQSAQAKLGACLPLRKKPIDFGEVIPEVCQSETDAIINQLLLKCGNVNLKFPVLLNYHGNISAVSLPDQDIVS